MKGLEDKGGYQCSSWTIADCVRKWRKVAEVCGARKLEAPWSKGRGWVTEGLWVVMACLGRVDSMEVDGNGLEGEPREVWRTKRETAVMVTEYRK